MAAEVGPDSTVSFTVKELLAEQTALLREIDRKVDTKADKADINLLHRRLDGHDQRIKGLEDERDADQAITTARAATRRRLWGFATAVVVPLAAALILVFVH